MMRTDLRIFFTITRSLLTWIGLLSFFNLYAQDNFEISAKNSTLFATDSIIPFWFAANQNGKIIANNTFLNISDIYIGQSSKKKENSDLSWNWGGNIVGAIGNTNYLQVNQLFASVLLKGWKLKGGMFHDSVRFAGLSTTNGNIARSGNARPYPMVRFSTNNFQPIPFVKDWLKFRFEFDEGVLNDDRFVEHTRLHHKSLYLLIKPQNSWNIHLGLEHYVMWGGKSKDEKFGQLPEDFGAYLSYVFGAPGDEDFAEIDQLNAAGNQIGVYHLEVVKQFDKLNTSFYVNHPFENYTGQNLRNWRDNLIGLHLDFNNKNKLITDLVYEFTHTRHQSISDSFYIWNEATGKWTRPPFDNYFTHYVYESGYTYHRQAICSPLFFPVLLKKDGSPIGKRAIRSTRFISHHIGIKGKLMESLTWKGLLTSIHHFGLYVDPYDPSQKQLSGLIEVEFIDPDFPLELGMSVASDFGNVIETNFGVQFSVAKSW